MGNKRRQAVPVSYWLGTAEDPGNQCMTQTWVAVGKGMESAVFIHRLVQVVSWELALAGISTSPPSNLVVHTKEAEMVLCSVREE